MGRRFHRQRSARTNPTDVCLSDCQLGKIRQPATLGHYVRLTAKLRRLLFAIHSINVRIRSKKNADEGQNSCYNASMKCPKCFNPLRRVASTEDSVWFTCPLGHRFHSETGSGISDSEGHRYAVSE